ncbi:hypothetical protein WR25_13223 [Diploscapter pachys]|uniref:Uncharacterized protein n=1 Tax=Diploscapter pachys TaxID=2018661 RepID=A0A2A2M482_9BILA|nr:hypothetical protein WR25_13223 [Diploscapter pachys]
MPWPVRVTQSDTHHAAGGHGVAGIHREVEERHFDLVAIGDRRQQPFGRVDDQLDLRADRRREQRRHVARQGDQIDRIGLQRLAPREGEQALHQGAGALGRLDRAVQQAEAAVAVGELAAQEIETAQDRGQQIVEIVRDAAGQLADRLHLLALPQRLFGALQRLVLPPRLGHVAARTIDQAALGRGQPGDPAQRSVMGEIAVFDDRRG